ncbi:LANO_0B07734g1_1 [Lachancea nothofagi CBS 11611]|uniref:LANO_0B07734g1_1 n=1 Tax=Lachancea nothofagi CBS 11611 TaxID=1266666 RepID=A0A1G4J0A6_9SACH|nr:LANO_0B07734g1_1 [Lachancea nothofagi CBS 11611]
MSTDTPQGLNNFPITKFCSLLTVGIPIFASIAGVKHWFLLYNDPFISEYKQYYRLLSFQVSAVNETDVALLTLIWYHLRHLERLFGSRKYLSIITLSWFYSSLTVLILAQVFNLNPLINWNRFTSGGLPTIMSVLHFYKEYTPQMYQFDVKLIKPFGTRSKQLKWTFNDQFVINALVAILLLNQGFVGVATGFLSWLCGVFIDKGLLPGSEMFRVPFFKQKSSLRPRQTSSIEAEAGAQAADDQQSSATGDRADEEPNDEPARPLGVQFLNTFRM